MEKPKLVSKKEQLKLYFENRRFIFRSLKQFSILVLVYGLAFSLTFYSLFNLNINIPNILALGFLAYCIKEEIPDIVRACKN